jgi:hypothetical protein
MSPKRQQIQSCHGHRINAILRPSTADKSCPFHLDTPSFSLFNSPKVNTAATTRSNTIIAE